MELDITNLRLLSLKDSDNFYDGGIPIEDLQLYKKIAETIEEKGHAYLTIEIIKGRLTEISTILVDQILGSRGTVYFLYKKEIVGDYTHNENMNIYFDPRQIEYHIQVYNNKVNLTDIELEELIDKAITLNYNNLLFTFGTKTDVDDFADKLDLSYDSRCRLHLIVNRKLQDNYFRKYNRLNPRLTAEIDLLETGQDEVYFGSECKKNYLNDEKKGRC